MTKAEKKVRRAQKKADRIYRRAYQKIMKNSYLNAQAKKTIADSMENIRFKQFTDPRYKFYDGMGCIIGILPNGNEVHIPNVYQFAFVWWFNSAIIKCETSDGQTVFNKNNFKKLIFTNSRTQCKYCYTHKIQVKEEETTNEQ